MGSEKQSRNAQKGGPRTVLKEHLIYVTRQEEEMEKLEKNVGSQNQANL